MVIITHSHGRRVGVRHITGGIKVYYLPFAVVYNQAILPCIYATLPLLRDIFVREQIQIVHGHSAFSPLCHDALLHAQTLGLQTVFTDHSLFGFADISSILTNKLLKFTLADVSHVVCVSHTSKENTVLRAHLDPARVSVIPNAVDTQAFTPQPEAREPARVTVVILSRLVYRKGVDLLVNTIPRLCRHHPHLHFIIGGGGPKAVDLEEMRDRHQLHDRVELLGCVPHTQVHSVLVRGDIFLNCSLTEAFCIAIIEAASCGLLVVSTNVGGIPEVLPADMILLAEPTVNDVVRCMNQAIRQVHLVNMQEMHRRVECFYNWHRIAERTERVYGLVLTLKPRTLFERLTVYYASGPVAGKVFVCVALLAWVLLALLEWLVPAASIDCCPLPRKSRPA